MHRGLLCLLLLASSLSAQENWPRFRGPNGQGDAASTSLPLEWNEASTLWKVQLPGGGRGSPVVWEGRVYLLVSDGPGFKLVCLDAVTGDLLWAAAQPGKPIHRHALNSSASTTPAVDNEGVYVSWGDGEAFYLAAYSHDGLLSWQKPLGAYVSKHGYCRSPIVESGAVVLASNQKSGSFVAAFDRFEGSEVWRTPLPKGTSSYSTPCVVDTPAAGNAIVTGSSEGAMIALDPADGKVLWSVPDALPARSVGSILNSHGMLYATSGSGGAGKLLVAVRAPTTRGEQPRIVHRITKLVPYVPTPLVANGVLVLWHDRGTVAGVDAETCERLWEVRIGGKTYASPIAVGGYVLNLTTGGEAVLLKVSRAGCKVAARNQLDSPSQATPAVCNGRLYISTEESLTCIGIAATARKD